MPVGTVRDNTLNESFVSGATVWKHGETLSTDNGVTMIGTAPNDCLAVIAHDSHFRVLLTIFHNVKHIRFVAIAALFGNGQCAGFRIQRNAYLHQPNKRNKMAQRL